MKSRDAESYRYAAKIPHRDAQSNHFAAESEGSEDNGQLSIVNCQFSITDTDIGIPNEKLENVFESFSQAHSSDTRKFGGTGLGLTISKPLVELMGGKIVIESEEGSGSTLSFTLEMPIGSKEKLSEQKSSEQIDGSILNGLKILLVMKIASEKNA